ncbi:MAG: PIN domain-containing protein [Prevotellaceae bacterium]|jgi:predicted nucleic acid-binding protein|nr:PIN domain-containing protein [Prevotellaceae bacterium]
MMAERFNKYNVSGLQNRDVFVDANVLISLFWSTSGGEFWEIECSKVYRALLRQGNRLFVDFLVISEITNRILRIEHKGLQPEQNFKQFRDSKQGETALSDIYSIIKNRILEDFNVIENSFSEADIENCLTINSLDFIDKGILKICQENEFVLFTNDKDYKDSDIDIITCNRHICY